jgi:hypothetical protein
VDRHVVVFDVNVYLDVADLVGEPFSWERFEDLALQHARDPVPHPSDRRLDALRALAVSKSGKFIGPQPLEIWSSDHINNLVQSKAEAALGWTVQTSRDLLATLVDDLVYDMSNGGSVGEVQRGEGSPPLDHEDSFVFATAHGAPLDPEGDYWYRYCITSDVQFRESREQLSSDVLVLYPHEWITHVRRVRSRAGFNRIRST